MTDKEILFLEGILVFSSNLTYIYCCYLLFIRYYGDMTLGKSGKNLCPCGAYSPVGKTEIITQINVKRQMWWSLEEKNMLGQPVIVG